MANVNIINTIVELDPEEAFIDMLTMSIEEVKEMPKEMYCSYIMALVDYTVNLAKFSRTLTTETMLASVRQYNEWAESVGKKTVDSYIDVLSMGKDSFKGMSIWLATLGEGDPMGEAVSKKLVEVLNDEDLCDAYYHKWADSMATLLPY